MRTVRLIGPILITLCISLIGLYFCLGDNRDDVEKVMDRAEMFMEEKPDSALALLNRIDTTMLKHRQSRARHALLKSMTLDKSYEDLTTFDVLQPALDYYLSHGTPDERLRTLFYQGIIHENAGRDDLAMQSYLNAFEFMESISDSLTLARLMVAEGRLLYRQYRISEFSEKNIQAADIFGKSGRYVPQIRSYGRALSGEVAIKNKQVADSIAELCEKLMASDSTLIQYVRQPLLMYTVAFGNDTEIKKEIKGLLTADSINGMEMNLARAYSRIGEPEAGLRWLDRVGVAPDNILDSLTYWSVKFEILEGMGAHKAALESYRNYSRVLEDYHMRLFSNELLFAERKHEMEMESMDALAQRDRLIMWIAIGGAMLVIITGWLYYRYRMNRSRRLMAERDVRNLQLEMDNQRLLIETHEAESIALRLKSEKLKSERDRWLSESERLRIERESLRQGKERLKEDLDRIQCRTEDLKKEGERLQREAAQLEQDNERYRLKCERLQNEADGLRDALTGEPNMAIHRRLGMLNGLFAHAVTGNERYDKELRRYLKAIRDTPEKFLNILRKDLEGSYPEFFGYLKTRGLTEREIGYVCLYAIGLRGKEIGNYLGVAGHYNISSDIRRKLGLDPNDRNLGPFLRNLLSAPE